MIMTDMTATAPMLFALRHSRGVVAFRPREYYCSTYIAAYSILLKQSVSQSFLNSRST
jgi:hypothetical protein